MANPVTGVGPGSAQTGAGGVGGREKQPAGGRSFENLLEKGQEADREVKPPDPADDARLEQMQNDLRQRLSELPPGEGRKALLPELIDTRTRMGLLREAVKSVGSQPAEPGLRGRFAQVESEWQQLEQLMRSERDFSPGELLGLQAQLYRVSQHIEVLSKVIDQVTGGIKTILNTNV